MFTPMMSAASMPLYYHNAPTPYSVRDASSLSARVPLSFVSFVVLAIVHVSRFHLPLSSSLSARVPLSLAALVVLLGAFPFRETRGELACAFPFVNFFFTCRLSEIEKLDTLCDATRS